MRTTFKDIKKLDVFTLSGTDLGSVVDLVLDTEGQHIVQYVVRSSILAEEHLISRDQIVHFEEDKLVVYDTAVPKEVRVKAAKKGTLGANPALMDQVEAN